MSNPYAAPSADPSATRDTATYVPKILAMSGRIGRVRYVAYALGISMLIMMLAFIPGVLFPDNAAMVGSIALLLYLPALFISMLMTVRRLNDMDYSGWWSLISFVPLLNFFLALILLFGRGSVGTNSYGPAPSRNTGGVIAAASILPALAFVGIIAAIAIPAYTAYVAKSRAAVQEMKDEAKKADEAKSNDAAPAAPTEAAPEAEPARRQSI